MHSKGFCAYMSLCTIKGTFKCVLANAYSEYWYKNVFLCYLMNRKNDLRMFGLAVGYVTCHFFLVSGFTERTNNS